MAHALEEAQAISPKYHTDESGSSSVGHETASVQRELNRAMETLLRVKQENLALKQQALTAQVSTLANLDTADESKLKTSLVRAQRDVVGK